MPLRLEDLMASPEWATGIPNEIEQQISAQLPISSDAVVNSGSAWDWTKGLSPRANLFTNALNLGLGFAESQGFDVGVFGVLNPNDDLMGNMMRAGRFLSQEGSEDWAGDFAGAFGNPVAAAQQWFAGFTDDFFSNDFFQSSTMTPGAMPGVGEAKASPVDRMLDAVDFESDTEASPYLAPLDEQLSQEEVQRTTAADVSMEANLQYSNDTAANEQVTDNIIELLASIFL